LLAKKVNTFIRPTGGAISATEINCSLILSSSLLQMLPQPARSQHKKNLSKIKLSPPLFLSSPTFDNRSDYSVDRFLDSFTAAM